MSANVGEFGVFKKPQNDGEPAKKNQKTRKLKGKGHRCFIYAFPMKNFLFQLPQRVV